jgi:hypothetical protein
VSEALVKTTEPKLIRYDAMVTAIECCSSVDEAREIRNKAIALAAYAKQALNLDNERKCCEIRIRAERKAGKLLRETASNGTRMIRKNVKSQGSTSKLADHGISKDQSSDWQRLATIPEKQFEAELKKPGVPSTNQILRSVYPQEKEPSPIANVDRDALNVWGMLCNFERNQLLARNAQELLRTMTVTMREDVERLTPKVIHWLEGLLKEN